jgi:hypothetical protein
MFVMIRKYTGCPDVQEGQSSHSGRGADDHRSFWSSILWGR